MNTKATERGELILEKVRGRKMKENPEEAKDPYDTDISLDVELSPQSVFEL